ncbi:MAG: winged helix-turn-helix domain-containing protein [Actinobacteria bacterium]|uniref:Unannotated protein n=1 Tax=freshwater metagenome TaxID=449393 RepID=A0A6J7ENE0_9ZZZZ|nr:winged helix-turn-helix domain-containing protein [Actinomycetota bacterium]
METMNLGQARRVALAAQGFGDPRPTGRVDLRHLRRVLDRMGLIQIDSVNVLVRSQELPLFARLGPHPRDLIHRATQAGELFEYWVHEASHVPTGHHHLHRWKMAQSHRWKGVEAVSRRRPGYVEEVYARVRDGGPLVAGELSARTGPKGPWWDWDEAKMVLEHLFWTGRITAQRRPNDFARIYDLTERVIPASALAVPTPPEREARKELLALAASHLGVGTLADLVDYHRQKATPCRPLVAELVEEGRLLPVRVEGWKEVAYLDPAADMPRTVAARALLSPFDPVVWNRPRAERLHDFRYRIEIYTPAPRRVYGYYVLPFLLGDELVGRVDLKADRARGTLLVQGAFAEDTIRTRAGMNGVAEALGAELALMAGWLGLERVTVMRNGALAGALARQRINVGA